MLHLTSTFARDTINEATRHGAPLIDLIDGEQLVQRLKEVGVGFLVWSAKQDTERVAWLRKYNLTADLLSDSQTQGKK